jgi:hypothetical protein
VLDSDRLADKSPAQAWAVLLDEGRYYCSIRTMYRILESRNEVRERLPNWASIPVCPHGLCDLPRGRDGKGRDGKAGAAAGWTAAR